MRCMKCGGEITDLNDVVDDGAGVQVRMHKSCLSAGNVSADTLAANPDYQPAQATGRFSPGQWTYETRPMIIKPHLDRPVSKADVPMFSTDQCALCKRPISGDKDTMRSGGRVAHVACVQTLLAFINEPEPEKPVQDSKPAATSVYPVQVKGGFADVRPSEGDVEYLEEKIARQNARFLVNVLAEEIREGRIK